MRAALHGAGLNNYDMAYGSAASILSTIGSSNSNFINITPDPPPIVNPFSLSTPNDDMLLDIHLSRSSGISGDNLSASANVIGIELIFNTIAGSDD